MEAEFEEMLNVCLTTNAPSEFLRLINCALQLRPRPFATLVLRHSRTCSVESLASVLQLIDNVVRRGGLPFQKVFETELAELFERAWKNSTRPVKQQLLKLYLGWRNLFPASLLSSIDQRMKANKGGASKRETPIPVGTPAMKRLKVEEVVGQMPQEPTSPVIEEMLLAPTPMRRMSIDDEGMDRDPNMIEIETDESEGGEDGTTVNVLVLTEILMKIAEQSASDVTANDVTSSMIGGNSKLAPSLLNVYHSEVYEALSQGTKETKPRFLDWRFQIRFDRRKQNCRSRAWYPPSEAWAHECNPTNDISPTQLLQRLMKPRQWKSTPMSVPVDEEDPQLYCGISGDPLEMKFDEETGKWNYVNCRRLSHDESVSYNLPDGILCLNECLIEGLRLSK